MALIGQGVMPVGIDYSESANSAWRLANSNAGALSAIAGKFEQMGEERKENKDALKAGQAKIKAIKELYPQAGGAMDALLAEMENEELPLSQRAAVAKTSNDTIAAMIDKLALGEQTGLERDRLAESARQFDVGMGADVSNAQGKLQFENQSALTEAATRFATLSEMVQPLAAKLPDMSGTSGMIQSLIDQENGPGALSAVEAYEKARIKQMEPFMGADGGKKLSQIGVGSGVLDVFVDPSGGITDLMGTPLNEAALGDGVLPPYPGDVEGVVPQDAQPARRIQPMPNLGFRPAAGAQTPAELKKQELEIAALEAAAAAGKEKGEVAAAESSARVNKLKTVADKFTFIDPKTGQRTANDRLKDVTGPFASVGKWVDKYADGSSFTDKSELQRFVEQDLLEATKDLKPVSEDEMKLLMSRRPQIDSPPQAWAQYMQEVLTFIESKTPASAQPEGKPAANPAQERLRQRLGQ